MSVFGADSDTGVIGVPAWVERSYSAQASERIGNGLHRGFDTTNTQNATMDGQLLVGQ